MTKSEEQARRAVVDEYGALVAELAPMKPKVSRAEELARIIRSWFEDADATCPHVVLGDIFQANIGAKGMQTVIDTAAAIKALGRKKLAEAVSFTLKALEAHLPAAIVSTLTRKEQTGSRSLSVAQISAEAKSKSA